MAEKTAMFLQGNIACAMGALRAGCSFYAGYPITPSNQIMHYLAKKLPESGGVFIQMEDEIASISAAIGASWSGAKAMTATSGPGLDLMQEGLGYAYMTETPCVIVNISRAGPSTGQATRPAQSDFYSVRFGAHGDYQAIVLSPWSVEEFYSMTIQCFNYAEQFRQPVILLADEAVAHLYERVVLPQKVEVTDRAGTGDDPPFGSQKDFEVSPMPTFGQGRALLVTGSTHDNFGYRRTTSPDVQANLNDRLQQKVLSRAENIAETEAHSTDDAETVFVSYGFSARAALETTHKLRASGMNTGLVRLKTLWPFPDGAIQKACERAKRIIVPEMSKGQLGREVERTLRREIISYQKTNGEFINPDELVDFTRKIQ